MFGQEKYSKEAFESEEERMRDNEKTLADLDYDISQASSAKAADLLDLFSAGIQHELREQITEAREKLSKMKMAGQKEANGLNEEYDNLCAKTARALEAQHTFEVEKLGMHKDGNEAETVV